MQMICVTFSGNLFVYSLFFCTNEIFQGKYSPKIYYIWIFCSCRNAQQFYDEVLNTPEDEQSKISLKAVENISKILTNFAKYG